MHNFYDFSSSENDPPLGSEWTRFPAAPGAIAPQSQRGSQPSPLHTSAPLCNNRNLIASKKPGCQRQRFPRLIFCGNGARMILTNDESKFQPSRDTAPQTAPILQGFDAGQAFQPAHLFSGTHLEGLVHEAHRPAAPADFPQTKAAAGGHHLDRPRVVPGPVHEPQCLD